MARTLEFILLKMFEENKDASKFFVKILFSKDLNKIITRHDKLKHIYAFKTCKIKLKILMYLKHIR